MQVAAPTLAELGIGRLFDLVPDAVVIGDVATGRVVAWNEAATLTFGHSEAEAVGMPLERLVPAELRAAHLAGLAQYAGGAGGRLTGSRELVELPALHADGSQFWVELRLAPVDTALADRRFVLAVFREVTSRRLAQETAAGALREAEAANAALRDFVAMAAHDLRSPVAGIGMALELLTRSGEALSEDQRGEVFAGARRHTKFVQGLLDDLMEVSQIEAGQLAPVPASIPVSELLTEATQIAGVPVQVQVQADPHLRIFADRGHAQRVLLNLIGNADKYGRPPILLSATAVPDGVALDVVDHGDGIGPELGDRMFDKFVRGPALPGGKAGAGLGLAIVAGLVRANAGAVSYAALPGGGSRFRSIWPTGGAEVDRTGGPGAPQP